MRGADSPPGADGNEGGSGVHPAFNQVQQRKEDSADCWVGPSCKGKEDQHLSLPVMAGCCVCLELARME